MIITVNGKKVQVLNVAEAAKELNVEKSTVYGYTNRNLIPYFKHRRTNKLYFTMKALDGFQEFDFIDMKQEFEEIEVA